MLRVALLSRFPRDPGSPRGGVESVTVVLAHALAQLGDLDVHVVTPSAGLRSVQVERFGGATIHRLPADRWPLLAEMLGGPALRRFARYLRDLAPTLLHTHEPFGRAMPAFAFPQVSTVHGFESENILSSKKRFAAVRSRLWNVLERRDWARQRHIISIAPYVRERLAPFTRAEVFDIANPIEERFFAIPRGEAPGRILCVGWVSERKNTLGSVEAFARIAPRIPHARLVIAGTAQDAGYQRKLDETVARHALRERVEMTGHLNRAGLIEQLGRASVFLLPSLQENAPMAIEEAMGAGVPIVTSNRCGMPYMVQDGKTGFLIEPNDHDQIAQRLATLLENDQQRRAMGEAAQRWAQDNYHPRVIAGQTREVYQAALRR